MRSRTSLGVGVGTVVIAVLVFVVVQRGHTSHHADAIVAKVTPRSRPPHAACTREALGWGYQIDAAREQCVRGDHAPWFHAVITNVSAAPTYVDCRVTAWSRDRKHLFQATLPTVIVAPPAGVFLYRHRTRKMDWFFAADGFPQTVGHVRDVVGYTARCRPWTNPPI
jgi:hypothetical protein